MLQTVAFFAQFLAHAAMTVEKYASKRNYRSCHKSKAREIRSQVQRKGAKQHQNQRQYETAIHGALISFNRSLLTTIFHLHPVSQLLLCHCENTVSATWQMPFVTCYDSRMRQGSRILLLKNNPADDFLAFFFGDVLNQFRRDEAIFQPLFVGFASAHSRALSQSPLCAG